MSETSFRKFYRRSEFTALVTADIDLPLLQSALAALVLTVPFIDVTMLTLDAGVAVEWDSLPSVADVALVSAAIASFVGGSTTSQPFEYNSFSVATSTVGTPTTKLDNTTPPLDEGTYQVSWFSTLRMQAAIANTGIQADITLTRSDGASFHQPDSWDRNFPHAYNGSMPFKIAAGQTIRSLLTFSRLGASGTAEMSGARITVDKIS